jgi:hypothetical protein
MPSIESPFRWAKSHCSVTLPKRIWLFGVVALVACSATAIAQLAETHDPLQYGPYNGTFLADGAGLKMPIANAHDSILLADSPWTLYCWIRTSEAVNAQELVVGLGSVSAENPRFLGVEAGKVMLWMGQGNELAGTVDLQPGEWHLLAATFDGKTFTCTATANRSEVVR